MGEMRLEVTTKGGDIGAGEIAMGEMRLEVIVVMQRRVVVPRQAGHPPHVSYTCTVHQEFFCNKYLFISLPFKGQLHPFHISFVFLEPPAYF